MNTLHSLMAGILMLLALITVPVTTQAELSIATDPDLVGLWHMDGDWGDSSGNGHHGTPFRGVSFSSDKVLGSASGKFDGTSGYLELGNWFNYQTFSIEMWINPGTTQLQYADIIDNNHTNYRSWVIQQNSNNLNQYGGRIAPLFNLVSNRWNHVIITRDGTSRVYTVYINGSPFQSATDGSDINYDGTQFVRLSRWGEGGRYWKGLLDEVAIYKRVLTAEEVAFHRASGVSDPAAPTSPILGPVPSAVGASTITLTGTSALNTSIWVNGKKIAVTDASGNWAGTYGTLQLGANILDVTAFDSSNRLSKPVTVTVYYDNLPPATPVIAAPVSPTNSSSIILAGTKEADSWLYVNGQSTSAPFGDTAWSHTANLSEGSNTITAYVVDTAGNISATATATLIVDTNPPVVGATPAGGIYKSTQSVVLAANEQTVIYYTLDGSTPTASATVYSHPIPIPSGATLKYFARDLAGNNSEIRTENYVIDTTPPVLAISTLSDGTYTNNEILNIAGTVMDDTEVTGITVNDTAVPVNAEGSFSYALLLKNGANIITIAATDSVGNMAADIRTVTLDQTAPVLAVTTPADNSKTGKMLLEVSGTVGETSAVTVKIKDLVQSALMNGGTFTATVILEPGYNTIEITAVDLAGNRSTLKRTVVFDDQVPSLAVIVPSQDIRTNQRSLTIKGAVSHDLTAVGVTISKDDEIFTPPVIDGTFEQAVDFTEEKTYSLIVTATNEVGTSTSVQRNFIYDITPPALSIDSVTSPTSQPNLSVTGTRETGTAVTVTCATATVGEISYPTETTWLVEVYGLREDENVITAASADAAGNAVMASATVVLATIPPEITIMATPDVIWPPNHQMVPVTIAGGVECNGSAIKSVSISVSDEYGKLKYNNLTFGSTVMLEAWRNGNDTDGRKYTITVVVTDKRGIMTAKTATVTVPHSRNQGQTQKRQGFQPNSHKSASSSVRARGNK